MPGDLTDTIFLVTNLRPGMTSTDLIEARTRQLLCLPEDIEQPIQIPIQASIQTEVHQITLFLFGTTPLRIVYPLNRRQPIDTWDHIKSYVKWKADPIF